MLYHQYGQELRRHYIAGVPKGVIAILDLPALVLREVVYEPTVEYRLARYGSEAHHVEHRQHSVLPEEDPS